MNSSAQRAEILVEALPYIEAFHGKTIVVKYGGSLASADLSNFVRDLILMKYVGIMPVVVHGGGPQIQEYLNTMGIKSEFIAGLRVTSRQVMEVCRDGACRKDKPADRNVDKPPSDGNSRSLGQGRKTYKS